MREMIEQFRYERERNRFVSKAWTNMRVSIVVVSGIVVLVSALLNLAVTVTR